MNNEKNNKIENKKKYRPRPKRTGDLLSSKLDFRVTPEEKNYIDDSAKNMEIKASSLIRSLIFDYELEGKTDTELRKQIVVALGRMNGNINQIAKKINSNSNENLNKLVDEARFMIGIMLDDLAFILDSKKKLKKKKK